MNKEFILGYILDTDELKQFNSKEEADYVAEDWCVVKAPDLETAKENYEENFLKSKESGFSG